MRTAPVRLFPNRRAVKNPQVIVPKRGGLGGDTFVGGAAPGDFFHVTVTSPEEWYFLTLLDHRKDKFAAVDGAGVYVRAESLKGL